nr:hypothetical protein [Seinonella peptonophila]
MIILKKRWLIGTINRCMIKIIKLPNVADAGDADDAGDVDDVALFVVDVEGVLEVFLAFHVSLSSFSKLIPYSYSFSALYPIILNKCWGLLN